MVKEDVLFGVDVLVLLFVFVFVSSKNFRIVDWLIEREYSSNRKCKMLVIHCLNFVLKRRQKKRIQK